MNRLRTLRSTATVLVISSAVIGAPSRALAQERTWQVGVVCPLTTSSKSFGIGHLQGVTLAFEDFRSRTKLPVELEIVDDQSNPDLGTRAVQRLMDRGVLAILGPCNSSVAKKVLQRPELHLPMVSSLTTASDLTKDPHPYFFRANVSDAKRMTALLEALFDPANGARPDHLVLLYEENDPFGVGMLNDAKSWLAQNQKGFAESSRVIDQSYHRDLGTTGAEGLIQGLPPSSRDADDAWLLLGLSTDARSIVTVARNDRLGVKMYLPGPEPEVFKSMAREGVDVADVRFISVWDETDATLGPFKGSFMSKFDEPATYDAALGFDGARALFWALEKVLPTAGNAPIEQIREQIRSTLTTFDPSTLMPAPVLNGDEHFDHGGYRTLKFVGLKFDYEGNSIQLKAPIPPRKRPTPDDTIPVALPRGIVLLVVGAAGFAGSVTRKIYKRPEGMSTKAFIRYLCTPEVLIADPLISVVVFVTLFLAVLVFNPSLSSVTARLLSLNYPAAIPGFLAGYLGVRALHVVLEKIGVARDSLEKDTHASAAVTTGP